MAVTLSCCGVTPGRRSPESQDESEPPEADCSARGRNAHRLRCRRRSSVTGVEGQASGARRSPGPAAVIVKVTVTVAPGRSTCERSVPLYDPGVMLPGVTMASRLLTVLVYPPAMLAVSHDGSSHREAHRGCPPTESWSGADTAAPPCTRFSVIDEERNLQCRRGHSQRHRHRCRRTADGVKLRIPL